MLLTAIAFYLFAAVLTISSLLVVAARNPVHAVLFLILAFFNAAGLFVLLGAEFLAMILVVVYVGAVAVLFLFVVMMLDIDFADLKRGWGEYLPLGSLLALLLIAELVFAAVVKPTAMAGKMPVTNTILSNTEAIGRVLYTDYIFYFQTAGLVLLVAMIGAIVLTLRSRPGVRKQSIALQNARDPAATMAVLDVKPGQGA
ncbi:MAG TPA: NADH-quinone oxidoreductase subunit J [Rhizomicrobium sp.]|jgi:NADH-quinone oxidoreductase subunit J